ncbi:hypothetical protein [Agathobaculum sp. Marseille-P7918]|uniref:hypothetical protein n=1 Tax=Agathobaculum sp. Marseille-P7918 TaxID=2479843 RepID=UPI0035657F34
MKEELIRVENGHFQREGSDYQFDIAISRGECIGIYVDEHLTSGTAFLDIFKGYSHMKSGKVFLYGRRMGSIDLEHWVMQHSIIADKFRFDSKELTVWDFMMALSKPMRWRKNKKAEAALHTSETAEMLQQMGLFFSWTQKLCSLSLLDYYRLSVFRVWFWKSELLILDRLTEILRWKDLEQLMQCIQILLKQGTSVMLCDMDEEFLYQYTSRVEIIKNRKSFYRLYPEEYDDRLYEILGWKRRSSTVRSEPYHDEKIILSIENLTFPKLKPLNFQIRSGEIAFLRDENYNTVSQIRDCFLREQSWLSGEFRLNGKKYEHSELSRIIGTEIGIQIERPDRPSGVLFDKLTALDNLSICLLPKAGRHIIRKKIMGNIQQEASRWFNGDALLRPLCEWTLPERLRFSYYKWYLLNPRLLICYFPFAGQESAHHEMIIDMLVTCARRGMAIWVISSGIDAICEKTQNKEFLQRLHYINE